MSDRQRSILDDFFEPPTNDSCLAVLRAVISLHDRSAPARDRSHGRIARGGTFNICSGKPTPDGLFSKEVFGDDDARSWRFGHVDLPPVVHPACAEAIAGIIGITVDEVMEVARTETSISDGVLGGVDYQTCEHTGVPALKRAAEAAPRSEWHTLLEEAGFTVDDLFVESVPVPPAADRELPYESGDVRATFPSDGTVNDAFKSLIWRQRRYLRLAELDAPPIILAAEMRELQEAFEHVLREVRTGNRDNSWKRLPDEGTILVGERNTGGLWEHRTRSNQVRALLWLDEDTLLEQVGGTLRYLDAGTGEVRATSNVPQMPLRSVHGRYVAFIDSLAAFVDDSEPRVLHEFALLDVDSGEFLAEGSPIPEDIPLYVVQNDQPEDLFLVDARHDRTVGLPICSDRPQLLSYTRDGRYALVGGDEQGGRLLELHTGLTLASLDHLDLRYAKVDHVALPDQTFDDPEEIFWFHSSTAVHKTDGDTWQWLSPSGVVGAGETPHYRLAFDISAAAFSPSGARLAVRIADADEILVADARVPEVLLRIAGIRA